MIQSALEGIRVLDLTHYVAGPFATKLLADYGADVVKIERPGGDGSRRMGPFPRDVTDPERSATFLALNIGKRSLVVDLAKPAGREVVADLARTADVLVENFRPGTIERLGLGFDDLSRINPGLVMVSISDFGQTGPYRDYRGGELVDFALGGAMYVTGQPDRNPLKLGRYAILTLAGTHAAAAAGTALMGRAFDAQGDWIDISIMETQAGSPDRRTPMLVGYQYTGQINTRGRSASPPVRPSKDGYINLQFGLYWLNRVANMLEQPELKQDPRFSDPAKAKDPVNIGAFEAIYMAWLSEKSMAEAWSTAQRHRVPSGPIYSAADVLADANYRRRRFWETIDHPDAGPLTYPGIPFTTFGAAKRPRRPAPRLGQHTDEVLRGLGYSKARIAALMRQGVVA